MPPCAWRGWVYACMHGTEEAQQQGQGHALGTLPPGLLFAAAAAAGAGVVSAAAAGRCLGGGQVWQGVCLCCVTAVFTALVLAELLKLTMQRCPSSRLSSILGVTQAAAAGAAGGVCAAAFGRDVCGSVLPVFLLAAVAGLAPRKVPVTLCLFGASTLVTVLTATGYDGRLPVAEWLHITCYWSFTVPASVAVWSFALIPDTVRPHTAPVKPPTQPPPPRAPPVPQEGWGMRDVGTLHVVGIRRCRSRSATTWEELARKGERRSSFPRLPSSFLPETCHRPSSLTGVCSRCGKNELNTRRSVKITEPVPSEETVVTPITKTPEEVGEDTLPNEVPPAQLPPVNMPLLPIRPVDECKPPDCDDFGGSGRRKRFMPGILSVDSYVESPRGDSAASPDYGSRQNTSLLSSPALYGNGKDSSMLGSASNLRAKRGVSTGKSPRSRSPHAAPSPRRLPLPGRSVTWKKGALIGKGAFGTVHVGLNCATGEMMAVKNIQFNYRAPNIREMLTKLQNEVTLMKNLEHPNIVRYFFTERAGESINIFMEYVPGGSVADLVKQFGALSQDTCCFYSQQILFGVEYLHRQEVIHRDIKGANILLTVDGECKLGDFGASAMVSNINPRRKSLQGTPLWMAPEVITQQEYDSTVDIWSLGCTVLEMITGDAPFAHLDCTQIEVLQWICDEDEELTLPSAVSEIVASFVHACLKRAPRERPLASHLLEHEWIREAWDEEDNMADSDGGTIPPKSPRERARVIDAVQVLMSQGSTGILRVYWRKLQQHARMRKKFAVLRNERLVALLRPMSDHDVLGQYFKRLEMHRQECKRERLEKMYVSAVTKNKSFVNTRGSYRSGLPSVTGLPVMASGSTDRGLKVDASVDGAPFGTPHSSVHSADSDGRTTPPPRGQTPPPSFSRPSFVRNASWRRMNVAEHAGRRASRHVAAPTMQAYLLGRALPIVQSTDDTEDTVQEATVQDEMIEDLCTSTTLKVTSNPPRPNVGTAAANIAYKRWSIPSLVVQQLQPHDDEEV
eukprot:Hpha_TRINITY_DN15014_c1_g2::TRINITY_DN15014_c1_g2_i1::g.124368::m.124368